ncbi:unnamed protein product [Rotaria sp. Silwood1]|nr:unnamed protein product [Rotaria sp. Silwood1]
MNFTVMKNLFQNNPFINYWRFQVALQLSNNRLGWSATDFHINQPPYNGTCRINPSTGDTNYKLSMTEFYVSQVSFDKLEVSEELLNQKVDDYLLMMNQQANTREHAIRYLIDLRITIIDSVVLQATTLAQLTDIKSELTRKAIVCIYFVEN